MARLKDSNWVDALPCVLLGIRSIPKEDLKCSAAELVYGTPLKVPGNVSFLSTSTLMPPFCLHLLHLPITCFYRGLKKR